MSAKKVIRHVLTTDAAVAAIVSARVQPWQSPQQFAAPRIVYRRSSKDYGPDCLSEATPDCKLDWTESFEVSCISTTELLTETLADAVEAAFMAVAPGTTIQGVAVESIDLTNRSDEHDVQIYGDNSPVFVDVVEITIKYTRAC